MARPRLTGPREPNGRLARSGRTQNLQRELDMLRTGACDPKWGTQVGVLCRAGKITPRQMDAGLWFAEAAEAADRALSLPSRHCRAQDINAVHGSSNGEDDAETIAAKRKDIAKFDRICAFVGHGSKALAALQLVIVHDHRPDRHEVYLALVDGLEKLLRFQTVRRAA